MSLEASDVHKQRIGITLRQLERALIGVEDAVGRPSPAARMTAYVDPVAPPCAWELLGLVADARREIESIADDLALAPQEESVTRALAGELHVRVVSVVELRPRFLRGGGEVPPPLAEYLEAKSVRLEGLVRRLIGLLQRQTDRA
jgi:hypothetical protein